MELLVCSWWYNLIFLDFVFENLKLYTTINSAQFLMIVHAGVFVSANRIPGSGRGFSERRTTTYFNKSIHTVRSAGLIVWHQPTLITDMLISVNRSFSTADILTRHYQMALSHNPAAAKWNSAINVIYASASLIMLKSFLWKKAYKWHWRCGFTEASTHLIVHPRRCWLFLCLCGSLLRSVCMWVWWVSGMSVMIQLALLHL